jgi:protein-S-isoprenylcysteine O-methyltransferase Ste14
MSSPYSDGQRLQAVAWGGACHVWFAAAIVWMAVGLHEGMRLGLGPLTGGWAWITDAALAASFPALHSWLLTPAGARCLDRVAGASLGRDLRTTTYVLIASVHLLLVFTLWSPAGAVLWSARGAARAASELAFAGSWLLVGKTMWDAGLAVQTGFLGWGSVARGCRPAFRPFTPRGSFRFTRQPIYLAFTLALWTGPVLTSDRLLIASTWTLYCVVGPLWKERRMLARDPDRYRRYQTLVPYWLPRIPPLQEDL